MNEYFVLHFVQQFGAIRAELGALLQKVQQFGRISEETRVFS